jgi:hypothetical protein
MTHLEIITKTSQDKELRQICKKIGGNLSDDLFQELMIILLEYNETKLVDIYNKGYYKWFLVKTLTNQFNSNSSPFNKKYRPKDIDFIISETYDHSIDITIDKINKQLNKLHWYDRELFKAYIESGSYRKLSKQTDIPFNSISRTINHVKNFIRDNIN